MTKFVDIHTHALTHDPRIAEVQVLDSRIPFELNTPSGEFFCAGMHPWHIGEANEELFFAGLKSAMQSSAFFALGEIGVDRAKDDNLEDQLRVFKKQLEYAELYRVERIVIHCVKAYFDILPELKKLSRSPVIVLHDFNANMETAEKFMRALDKVYFSFGAKLFNPKTKAFQTFKELPLERIFLETDDQFDYGILKIYRQAAQIREVEREELKAALAANFDKIAPQT